MFQNLSSEDRATVNMAIGRIFRLGSRPEQPGDGEEYERCRSVIMAILGDSHTPDYRPNYVAQRHSGAQGD